MIQAVWRTVTVLVALAASCSSGGGTVAARGETPSGASWTALTPDDATGTPVIYLHGATQHDDQIIDDENYPFVADLGERLVEAGHPVLAVDQGDTWGNAAALAVISEAADRFEVPVVVIGGSMGGGAALSWAAAEPERVACVAGIVPVSDLRQIVADNPSNLAVSVEGAHPDGVSESNPLELAEGGRLDGLRYRAWFGTDDEVVDPATVEAVAAAIGVTASAVPVGGGHDTALDSIDVGDVVDFVEGC